MTAAGFTPWRVHPYQVCPHINSTSNQVLKIYLYLTDKKDNIVSTVKQNHTKHVYFSFFNPLKGTGDLEIESLAWVHGDGLTMGQNRYHLIILYDE